MITFGLTGGIACGKSTVTKTFRKHGIPIVDADVIAREVVMPNTVGWSLTVDMFGPSILYSDKTINRAALAKIVFEDKKALRLLTHMMNPLIQKESEIQIKALHDQGNDIVGYDAALICEMGNANKYHPLIVVACPQYMQIERLMRRNNLSFDDAVVRVSSQMPTEKKVAMADFVIDTSGSMQNSILTTETIIKAFRWAENFR